VEWIETVGRTVEEALEAALDQLGVDERDAEYVVVEEPRTGLFGRLRSEARVRARVRPTRPRSKGDRQDRSAKRRPRPARAAGSEQEPKPAVDDGGEPSTQEGEKALMEPDVPLSEQAEVARQFLDGLVARFGLEGSVGVSQLDDETVEVSLDGQDLGILIGPKGATLAALQDVTRTVVNRKTGARQGRIVLDVAGYRQKRKVALARFIQDVAAEVKETGVAKALEPMTPSDRKVVHDTVNEIEGVSTTSEGEEPARRVVIQPG
jgi:spoIIIJ-associated protein